MVIPVDEDPWAATEPALDWTKLEHDAKRERILHAAGRIFTAQGLDAPMPAIAAAAGAGIGSIYRQFPSKHDLLSALVTRRLEQAEAAALDALRSEEDPWSAFRSMLLTIVERQSGDDFLGEAMIEVQDHPDVVCARVRALAAIDLVMAAARTQGRLRADATNLDLQLLFAATRAARHVEPAAWKRMLTLLIDGLESRP